MRLKDLTDFMSEVGRERPDLVQDRNVALFIDLVIERARVRTRVVPAIPDPAPVDFDPH